MPIRTPLTALLLVIGCSPGRNGTANSDGAIDGALTHHEQTGCGSEHEGCYTVYAHSDHTLFRLDLPKRLLVEIGRFNAPKINNDEDIITDLAVAPDDTIYVISKTRLYTADPRDGHVTQVGTLTDCGSSAVALTFTTDANLYTADFKGAFCRIDRFATPPTVIPIGTLGDGLAITGDLVAVGDGTMYGTAYRLADGSGSGTQANNLLVRIDPSTGRSTQRIGSTGFPKLFAIAFSEGQVFGFTHDGTGRVVTIDPRTGVGTLYNTFSDPSTNRGISFAGAGVNAMVAPTIP